jgi:hypothetical protein
MPGNTALLIVDLQVAMFESESDPPIHDAHGLLQRSPGAGRRRTGDLCAP